MHSTIAIVSYHDNTRPKIPTQRKQLIIAKNMKEKVGMEVVVG